MPTVFSQVQTDFQQFHFIAGQTFIWQPQSNSIIYDDSAINDERGLWSVLHELGHALLQHANYRDDLELLIMEVAAWKEAKSLAARYKMSISQEHIDDCIDTYRNWLHQRSRCVECKTHSLQIDHVTYHCHNCRTKWRVPASRMCITRKTRIK